MLGNIPEQSSCPLLGRVCSPSPILFIFCLPFLLRFFFFFRFFVFSFFQPPFKRARFETGAYRVPEWELLCAFDLLAALEHFKNRAPKWISVNRVVDVEHILDHLLPSVYEISLDEKNASPVLLKVCDPDSFFAEEIHQPADIWAKLSAAQVNSDEIVNWICSGVHPQLYYSFQGRFCREII